MNSGCAQFVEFYAASRHSGMRVVVGIVLAWGGYFLGMPDDGLFC